MVQAAEFLLDQRDEGLYGGVADFETDWGSAVTC